MIVGELVGWVVLVVLTAFLFYCWYKAIKNEPMSDAFSVIVLIVIVFGTVFLPIIWLTLFWEEWCEFWSPIKEIFELWWNIEL